MNLPPRKHRRTRPLRRRLTALTTVLTVVAAIAVAQAGAASALPATDTFDFGDVQVGQTAIRTYNLQVDPGAGISSEKVSGPFGFQGQACDTASSCSLTLSWTPTEVGSETGTFRIEQCTNPDGIVVCDSEHPLILTVTGNAVQLSTGTMTASPGTVRAGGSVSATSVTPCPAGATSVKLSLLNDSGTEIASKTAAVTNSGGNWAGTLVVPTTAAPGDYFVTGKCTAPGIIQYYNYVPLTVNAAAPPPPPGPAPTTLTPANVLLKDPVIFRATLTSDGTPVAGKTVQFSTKNILGGTVIQCSGITATNGVATCTTTKKAFTFNYNSTYTARFAGDANYVAATAIGQFAH